MNKIMLLANAAALALTAGSALGAVHPGARADAPNLHRLHRPQTEVLYDQNNPDTSHPVFSDNYTSGNHTAYETAGADDFVVPAGHKWTITEVDVSGEYGSHGGNCTSGCAASEVVTFYKSKHKNLGAIAGRGADTFTLNCTDNSGNFACSIPNNSRGKPVTLRGGRSGMTYWVSVVPNINFDATGVEWLWYLTDTDSNNPGKWENPANGYLTGCTTWTNLTTCLHGDPADDLAFRLIGTQK